MSAIDVVAYADDSAGFLSDGSATPPVVEWLDGLPRRARIKLIARLEALESRGAHLHGPLTADLGQGIRAVWCHEEGARHLILYGVAAGPARPAAVLLHGVSIPDAISDIPGRRLAVDAPRRHATRMGHAAPAPEQMTDVAPYGPLAARWAHVIPQADVELAADRLRRFQTQPDAHAFDDW
jgi:hypothetical protein